jgi:hypothetical protein
MEQSADMTGPEDGEGPKQRVDRELRETLEEIRVALPQLQLLFGFLLILPFSERFGALEPLQDDVYIASLIVTAGAMALFVAPTAQHRLGFRTVNKQQLLIRTNRQVIAGLALVVLAITLAIFLVTWVVLDTGWAWLIAVPIAGWFAHWWFVVPLLRRERAQRRVIASTIA